MGCLFVCFLSDFCHFFLLCLFMTWPTRSALQISAHSRCMHPLTLQASTSPEASPEHGSQSIIPSVVSRCRKLGEAWHGGQSILSAYGVQVSSLASVMSSCVASRQWHIFFLWYKGGIRVIRFQKSRRKSHFLALLASFPGKPRTRIFRCPHTPVPDSFCPLFLSLLPGGLNNNKSLITGLSKWYYFFWFPPPWCP